ncbi:SIR2 family protein [Planomicrobium chinense]|uniref:SIR2 family protein n=1 Tax=Planococcus chinensis TaxID=272917 RepID=UPI001CC81942|nr:SIR2 family protein [Planococcus chinensis]MBZ5201564.1 SIR2 family protein [Planococcus chinensis]
MSKAVLIGNGLSVGLNKDFALPRITERFYNRLNAEHKGFVKHHMERIEKNEYIQTDFEEAIASIEQSYDALKNYYDFISNGNEGEYFKDSYNLEEHELYKHVKAVKEIIYEYTASILDLIDGHVRWGEIRDNLQGFLEWLDTIIDSSTTVEFFTLNFDLLLETILLETIGTENFQDFHVPRDNWNLIDNRRRFFFSPDLSQNMFGNRKVKLHHLHGSLSSFKDIKTGKTFKITTEDLRMHNVYKNIFNLNITPSIVTGGGKSVKVQEDPFKFYYNNFRKKMAHEDDLCDELYIIGYSFRDDHINESLCKRLEFERKKENPRFLKNLLIVDFKSSEEDKEKFVNDINRALKLGPRMSNRFIKNDPRIKFNGVNNIIEG